MRSLLHLLPMAGLTVALVLPDTGYANPSDDEVAIELINPIGNMVSFYNGFEYRSYQGTLPGAGEQTRGYYTFTPSVPFKLKNGKTLVLRAALPTSFATPAYLADGEDHAEWLIRKRADTLPTDGVFVHGHSHFDDISYDIAYGGVSENGVITMIGLAGVLPTSQDGSIERDEFLLGPEFAIGKVTSWGIYGFWFKHLTAVADMWDDEVDWDSNDTSVKIFFAYGLGNGWNIISNPLIEYDWDGAADNKLQVPIGGGISKTTRLGKLPVKMDFELYYYAKSTKAFGSEWMMSFSITPALWTR